MKQTLQVDRFLRMLDTVGREGEYLVYGLQVWGGTFYAHPIDAGWVRELESANIY